MIPAPNLAISTFQGTRECCYTVFPLDYQGLRDAREHLTSVLKPGYRRSVSPWQFAEQWHSTVTARAIITGIDDDATQLKALAELARS